MAGEAAAAARRGQAAKATRVAAAHFWLRGLCAPSFRRWRAHVAWCADAIASWPARRALLTPRVDPGSCYRACKST